jgi:hypothetical protein
MKKLIAPLFLLFISFPSFGKDFIFVLKCVYEDKRSSPSPFYFIGKEKGKFSQIIYLKSEGKILSFKGGESKNLKFDKQSIEFYEYKFHQKETPNFNEYFSKFVLDRSSLRLIETYDLNTKNPMFSSYVCKKESNEQKSYSDAMLLKSIFDSGVNNKI